MESGRTRTVSSATSRRELRARRAAAPSRRRFGLTTVTRSALLLALGAATIAVPVAEELAGPSQELAAATLAESAAYPSAYEVLASSIVDPTPTSLLAAVPGAVRMTDSASRVLERSPLPDCDGTPVRDAQNGQIASADLCALWAGHMLRGDAAMALAELNLSFRATFGCDLCLTDSYRTLAEQRRLAYTKGSLAAAPGQSNHGWGLAIDLCSSETSGQVWRWLNDNGPVFGWENPPWAKRGGSGPYEPWHWEYVAGTIELGTDWGRN